MSWLSRFLNRISYGKIGRDPRENALVFPVNEKGSYVLTGQASRDAYNDARKYNAPVNESFLKASNGVRMTGGGVYYDTDYGGYTQKQKDDYFNNVKESNYKSYNTYFSQKKDNIIKQNKDNITTSQQQSKNNINEDDIKIFSKKDSYKAFKDSGLSGFGLDEGMFAGVDEYTAKKSLEQLRDYYLNNSTENTSYTYDPQNLTKSVDAVNNFKLKVNDLTTSAWETPETAQEKTIAYSKKTLNEIARLYDDPKQFADDYLNNKDFAKEIDSLSDYGITKDKIMAEIKERPKLNLSTLPSYLTQGKSESELKALAEPIPKDTPTIQEVMKLTGIPKEYADIYFGTPEVLGVFQEEVILAEEKLKNIEKEERDTEKEERERAELLKEKYELEFKRAKNDIEQNRLTAKNYLTGMLAKLGALNTTGKAPEAIANLEQKYQLQLTELENNFKLQKLEIDMKLDERLNDIESKFNEERLKIEADLSKDRESILKELLKLKAQQDKEIANSKAKYEEKYSKYVRDYKDTHGEYARNYIENMYEVAHTFDPIKLSKELGVQYKDGMTFQEYLDQIQKRDRMTYTPPYRDKLFEDWKKAHDKSAELSFEAQMVLDGDLSWGQAKKSVKQELVDLGYHASDFEDNDDDFNLEDFI